EVQLSIVARVRNEGDIVAAARHKCDRRFLADQLLDRCKRAMTIEVALCALQWDPVLAQKIDHYVPERLTFFDRHQENIVAAVRILLRQDSDIGHENEPRI